jgi:hypothetical protein
MFNVEPPYGICMTNSNTIKRKEAASITTPAAYPHVLFALICPIFFSWMEHLERAKNSRIPYL